MTSRSDRPGQIVEYPYLWQWQQDRGESDGRKRRPVCIVAAVRGARRCHPSRPACDHHQPSRRGPDGRGDSRDGMPPRRPLRRQARMGRGRRIQLRRRRALMVSRTRRRRRPPPFEALHDEGRRSICRSDSRRARPGRPDPVSPLLSGPQRRGMTPTSHSVREGSRPRPGPARPLAAAGCGSRGELHPAVAAEAGSGAAIEQAELQRRT